jgi:hypothetical protein
MSGSTTVTNGNRQYFSVTNKLVKNTHQSRTYDDLAQLQEQLFICKAALDTIETCDHCTNELHKKVSLTANQTTPGTDGIDYQRKGLSGI